MLGVSGDTVRRWIEAGTLAAVSGEGERTAVDGVDLARLAVDRAKVPHDAGDHLSSARNRLIGLVTAIKKDAVMAQVEMQCGPFRMVSLMSSEAVEELGLQVGSRAAAVVKATTVIVEASHGIYSGEKRA